MAFSRLRRVVAGPVIWLIVALLAAFGAGAWVYSENYMPGVLAAILAALCGWRVIATTMRLRDRIEFIFDAARNEDFSYRFLGESRIAGADQALNALVSHLEKLTAEAREKEEYMGLVINLMDTAIAVVDEKGNVVRHNKAALRQFGRTAFTHICQIPADVDDLAVRITPVELKGRPMKIYTFSDLRQPLQQKEVESWERLTRVLTHEIMNSLTPVTSLSETLAKDGSGLNPEMLERLRAIADSGSHLMEFVANFRRFTIVPEPEMKVLYVKPFLEKVASLAASYPGGEGAEIRVTAVPADVMVYADAAMLRQVLLNLLKNALEAGATRVDLKASVKEDEAVQIEVTNDGAPIDPELAAQIFTPFFTTKSSGSGIGLSLSRRMITRMGGTLTLMPGPPTGFRILL